MQINTKIIYGTKRETLLTLLCVNMQIINLIAVKTETMKGRKWNYDVHRKYANANTNGHIIMINKKTSLIATFYHKKIKNKNWITQPNCKNISRKSGEICMLLHLHMQIKEHEMTNTVSSSHMFTLSMNTIF